MIHLMILTAATFVGGTSIAGLALHPRKKKEPSKMTLMEKLSSLPTLNSLPNWHDSIIGSYEIDQLPQLPNTEIVVNPLFLDAIQPSADLTIPTHLQTSNSPYSSMIQKLGNLPADQNDLA